MLYILLFVYLETEAGKELVLICRRASEINLGAMSLLNADSSNHYAIAIGEPDPTDNSMFNNIRRIMSEKLGLNPFDLKRDVKPDEPIIIEKNRGFTVVAVLAPNEVLRHVTTKTSTGGLYALTLKKIGKGKGYGDKWTITPEILQKAFKLVTRSSKT